MLWRWLKRLPLPLLPSCRFRASRRRAPTSRVLVRAKEWRCLLRLRLRRFLISPSFRSIFFACRSTRRRRRVRGWTPSRFDTRLSPDPTVIEDSLIRVKTFAPDSLRTEFYSKIHLFSSSVWTPTLCIREVLSCRLNSSVTPLQPARARTPTTFSRTPYSRCAFPNQLSNPRAPRLSLRLCFVPTRRILNFLCVVSSTRSRERRFQ